jgi:glutathione S-transferase
MAGGGDDLELLGIRGSPHVLRVRLALRLKGLTYDYVEHDPRNNNKIDDLLRHGKVPVLLINGAKPVRGSLTIIQYVHEAFPNGAGPSLLPADCHDRAIARYWDNFIFRKNLSTPCPSFCHLCQ